MFDNSRIAKKTNAQTIKFQQN